MPPDYALPGTQVEPEASYWARCPVPCAVNTKDVQTLVGTALAPYPTDPAVVTAEVTDLKTRFTNRDAPLPAGYLSVFLTDAAYTARPPVGAVHSACPAPMPFVKTGGELARLFQAETPGLWHHHVLNVLLDSTVPGGLGQRLSAPRQALIWAALDVAITSALNAAWHYKWLGPLGIRRRPRPSEFDPTLKTLFDYAVAPGCPLSLGPLHPTPMPSPGTPRHPAYPSGHSTYSAAASHVLGCLIGRYLPSLVPEFTKLAENIGQVRLWGGVHYQSDHAAGQLIGRAVGQLVIQQLNRSGIAPTPTVTPTPPPYAPLEATATAFAANCGKGTANFCHPIFLIAPTLPLPHLPLIPIPGLPVLGQPEPVSPGDRVEIGFQNLHG